jgi:hypothetical protein
MATLLRRDRALTKDKALADEAPMYIAGNSRLSPVEQLEIYREQFWLRHTASLIEDFPGLTGIIGQAHWEKLVESYFVEHAPTSWTLRDLGSRFASHVENATFLPHHDLCVDMTRLEWAYVELFDAPESPPLDAARLASVPNDAWSAAVFVLSPAVRLLSVNYPVADLRRQIRLGPGEPIDIPEPAPSSLVLYRGPDLSIDVEVVETAAFELLTALEQREPLLVACEKAAHRAPEHAERIAANVGAWFFEWGRRGFIVDVIMTQE